MTRYAALLCAACCKGRGVDVETIRPEPFFGRLETGRPWHGQVLGYLDKFIPFFHLPLRRHVADEAGTAPGGEPGSSISATIQRNVQPVAGRCALPGHLSRRAGHPVRGRALFRISGQAGPADAAALDTFPGLRHATGVVCVLRRLKGSARARAGAAPVTFARLKTR